MLTSDCHASRTKYLYDVENRWIGRDVDLDGDGTIDSRTRFIYDGNQIVLQFEGTVAGDADSASDLTAANLSHRYFWRPDAVDQLMADEQLLPSPNMTGDEGVECQADAGSDLSRPGVVRWTLGDNLGTIRDLALVDAETGATTVANHRIYDGFGVLKSQTDAAVDCLFGFTGRAFDSATGVQDNWHRKYDAEVGRWLNNDLMGFAAGDANTCRYVGNSPTNGVDPSGLWTIGPKKPVHETIVEAAAKAAGYEFSYEDNGQGGVYLVGKDVRFLTSLHEGTKFVDTPNGLSALLALYTWGGKPDVEKIKKFWGKNIYRDTIETHFGELQFRHGMTPHDNPIGAASALSAVDVRDKIVEWICGKYQAALDAQEAAKKAAKTGASPTSVHAHTRTSGKELGMALHTIADLYCPSHVWRDGGPHGAIKAFQDYSLQDSKKHGYGDDPDRRENKAYYAMAIKQSTELLNMFKAGKSKDEVKDWLLKGPLKLAPDAVNGGKNSVDPAYAIDAKTAGPATAMETYWAMA
ncbi:MAG TPA: hypothetical protein DD670_04295 [Planctomycetaceae bacterium]|nr:hypothetical protein [Planctomycetaceae bacterium]